MSLEKIKNKIRKEAEVEAKKLAKDVEKQLDELEHKSKEHANALRAKNDQEIKTAVQLFKDKTLAQARLESKRKLLETRESIIAEVIEDAVEKVCGRPKDYEKFLENTIKQNKKVMEGNVTVYANKDDKQLISSILTKLKIDGTVKEQNIKAGVILQDAKGKKINESIEARLERKRNDIRQTIAKAMKI